MHHPEECGKQRYLHCDAVTKGVRRPVLRRCSTSVPDGVREATNPHFDACFAGPRAHSNTSLLAHCSVDPRFGRRRAHPDVQRRQCGALPPAAIPCGPGHCIAVYPAERSGRGAATRALVLRPLPAAREIAAEFRACRELFARIDHGVRGWAQRRTGADRACVGGVFPTPRRHDHPTARNRWRGPARRP